MESITLQTSDSSVVVNDILGRLGFAASSESDGGDSVLVAAMIKAVAEETFGVNTNRTSIVFSTANSATAGDRLKITSDGHFVPFYSGVYDLGSSSYPFRNLYIGGDIGIGTASPSYKLDVNGTFSANSVNVNDQFTFPTTDGSANQVLVTDGSGVLSWQDQTGSGTPTSSSSYAMIHVFG